MSEKPRSPYRAGVDVRDAFDVETILIVGNTQYRFPAECRGWSSFRHSVAPDGDLVLSCPGRPDVRVAPAGTVSSPRPRFYTEEPVGPFQLLVMSLGRELHDREHPDGDWFGLVGSSVQGYCRRACEDRGIDWHWVREAISQESLDDRTSKR